MRVEKFLRKVIAYCMCVCLVLATAVSAFASETERKGSILLQLPSKADGVKLTLYKTAEYENGTFTFTSEFAESGITISDLNDANVAQRAAKDMVAFIARAGLEGVQEAAAAGGVLKFENLDPGLYLVAQTDGTETAEIQPALLPIPYMSSGGEGVIYDAVIAPKYSLPGGVVILTKVDEEGNALGNAKFVLQKKVYLAEGEAAPEKAETGKDEQGDFYWKEFKANLVSAQTGQIVITEMPEGVYRFMEVEAPSGYILSNVPTEFTITESGVVQEQENGNFVVIEGTAEEIKIVNESTSLTIHKTNVEGIQLSGAVLVIKDANGNVILDAEGNPKYQFTTKDEAEVLRGLPAGKYFLSEVSAPEGYMLAKDVEFTVEAVAGANNTVTMIDEAIEVTPTPTETPVPTPTETPVPTPTETPMPTPTETPVPTPTETPVPTPTETPVPTPTETPVPTPTEAPVPTPTETPVPTPTEAPEGEVTPTPEVTPEGEVTPTPEITPEGEVTPTPEVTPEITPEGEVTPTPEVTPVPGEKYSLEVTKALVTIDGVSVFGEDAVFYVALFADPDRTQRVTEVKAMRFVNSSVSTVTFENLEPDVPYYLGETDAEGNLSEAYLEEGEEMYVADYPDGYEVILTAEAPEGTIKFENVFFDLPEGFYVEEPTPTPTQKPSPSESEEEESGSGGGGGGGSYGGGGGGVKTGDETNIGFWLVLAVFAAVLTVALTMLYRKRRK